MNEGYKDLTQGVIWKKVLAFVLPLILTNLLQQAYNTVDLLIVGNLADEESMAAIGATGSLSFMLLGFFFGLSTGASVLVAQAFGAKDAEKTQRAVHTTYAVALTSGILMAALAWFFAPHILEAMRTPANIFDEALAYIRIYFIGSIPLLVYNMGTGILRAVGDSRSPLIYLIISSLINIVLDIIFVGPLGLRAPGAAVATVISQVITMLLLSLKLMHAEGYHRLELKRIRFYPEELREIFRIGIPSGIQSALISFSNVLIQSRINTFGHEAIAGVSAANRYDGFMMVGLNSFMMASTTFTGQNVGAKRIDRLKQGSRTTVIMGAAFSLIVGSLLIIFGRPLMGLFSSVPAVVEYGYTKIVILAPFHWIFTIAQVLSGVIRGAGKSFYPMAVSLFTMVGVRSFWIYTAASYLSQLPRFQEFGQSIDLIFWSYPLSWVLTCLFTVIYYFRKKWIPLQLRELYNTDSQTALERLKKLEQDSSEDGN